MPSTKKISLTLTYLVAGGCFASLLDIATNTYFFPLLFLFVLGIINDFKFKTYLPRWLLNIGGILISLLFLLDLNIEKIITPFANILLLLIVIKSLEDKRARDIYQILLLSVFGVAVSTTARLDPSFLLFFLYELFLGTVAFLFTSLFASAGDRVLTYSFLRAYSKFALLFPLTIALSAVPFFLILPRTHTPLFDIGVKRKQGLVSGIAGEIKLGKVGEIQQDNSVVMRIYGKLPVTAYWRVSVFDTLVGVKWVKTIKEREPPPVYKSGDYIYTVLLEPTYENYLPLLDYPLEIKSIEGLNVKAERLKGGYYLLKKLVLKPLKYKAVSSLETAQDFPDPVFLKVPEDLPSTIKKLAEQLSRNTQTPEEKIINLKNFFKKGFSYSLKLEATEGNPLEHFLFKSKKGNCEYFASATALLLRLMGIPSRIVGGFRGYIKNDYGDYYIVTNSMAHVWVEAYIGDKWIRLDTTPPYLSPAVRNISDLDLVRDWIVSFWYRNVVDFSAKKQISLFKSLWEKPTKLKVEQIKEIFLLLLTWSFVLSILVFAIRFYIYKWRKTPENLYRRLLEKLKDIEGKDFTNSLPQEILNEICDKSYYKEVEFIINLYRRHRYSPYKISSNELKKGYRMLRKI